MFTPRKPKGSTLILYVMVATIIIVPCIISVAQLVWLLTERSFIQSQIDAAAILAAKDLSRIVINDPHFGYISLSNYPPIGKGTIAEDGEPLPVFGINTLIGTIRQLTLVAEELDNGAMLSMAKSDHEALDLACQNLNKVFIEAVRLPLKTKSFDFQGTPITLSADVRAAIEQGLSNKFRIKTLKINTGWLNSGGNSTISSGKTKLLKRFKSGVIRDDREIPPFINIKTDKDTFQFTGVGTNATLCDSTKFIPADGRHLSSIIQIECSLECDAAADLFIPLFGIQNSIFHFRATAEPYSNPDLVPPGVMSVRFPGGLITSINSWSDLLSTSQFSDGGVSHFISSGGDYPTDSGATLIPSAENQSSETNGSEVLAECLYYWLRNGRCKPTVDAILNMVNQPFRMNNDALFFMYEFKKDGQVLARSLQQDPFPIGVISDQQGLTVVNTNYSGLGQCIVAARNEVKTLGTISGGKHGGQPLAGYPLDWCERQDFQSDSDLAESVGKGSKGTHLTVVGDVFCRQNGQQLTCQPRKTFYSGGLAQDVEISVRGQRFR